MLHYCGIIGKSYSPMHTFLCRARGPWSYPRVQNMRKTTNKSWHLHVLTCVLCCFGEAKDQGRRLRKPMKNHVGAQCRWYGNPSTFGTVPHQRLPNKICSNPICTGNSPLQAPSPQHVYERDSNNFYIKSSPGAHPQFLLSISITSLCFLLHVPPPHVSHTAITTI